MMYVGAYSNYRGTTHDGSQFRVRALEKLGHSKGRAERFLKQWRRQEQLLLTEDRNGHATEIFRSIVFVLPENFRLRNDIVQGFCLSHKCEWVEAKFHVYRVWATDIMGKSDDWQEVLTPPDSPAQAISNESVEKDVVIVQ